VGKMDQIPVGRMDRAGTWLGFGLYTILLLPILCGVWQTKGRAEGGSSTAQKSCNSIAPVWPM